MNYEKLVKKIGCYCITRMVFDNHDTGNFFSTRFVQSIQLDTSV